MERNRGGAYEFYKQHLRPEKTIAELQSSAIIDCVSLFVAATPVLQTALEQIGANADTSSGVSSAVAMLAIGGLYTIVIESLDPNKPRN